MSIAAQQNALLDEAKAVFGAMISAKIDAADEKSDTFEREVGQAVKDTILHIQNEYGYAISYYIAHDFERYANSMPDSPFTMSLEWIYAPEGPNPLFN